MLMYISGDTPKFARKLMFSGQKKPIQPLFPADGHMAELWDVAVGPNRERECLVGERARIANRMKATLARLGIRNFKPTLRGPAPAKAGGGGASCNATHPGGLGAAAKCIG